MGTERTHEMLLDAERVARRAIAIYEHSVKEADGCDPDWITSADEDVYWFTLENRAKAITFYASEVGIGFTEVRCTRAYMRINRDAIAEAAASLAAEDLESGEINDSEYMPTAETWEGEGWLYEDCEKGDPGAIPMWRCEIKPPPNQGEETR